MEKKAIKVLMIEDDRDFISLIQHGLASSRSTYVELDSATSLSSGLSRLSKGGIDVIVLDLNLKDSRGLDTLRRVHAQAETLPVVVLTGAFDETIGIGALKEGAQDYLTKGKIDHDALIRSIRYAMERMEQEARMRALLTSIPSILIGIGQDDRVTHWNEVAERTFGIGQDEVSDKPFHECGVEWDFKRILDAISECRKKNAPVRLDDIYFKRLDGKRGLLGITVNPIKGLPGVRPGILFFGADVTERRQLEAHLRQTTKMESLGELAGAIAHEFKNMLTPMLWQLSATRKELPKETASYERLERAQASAERAMEFAKQILTFGRQADEKKRPIELSQVVDEGLSLIRRLLKDSLEITTDLTSKSSTIFADPNQIHQVLMNLLTNASYAMRKSGGKVHISVEPVELDETLSPLIHQLPQGHYVKLVVTDSGEGIPPDVLEHVFEPFFTTKPEGEGTGMGLAVVYGIVTGHEGTITVSSEPGRGTTFEIYFPALPKSSE